MSEKMKMGIKNIHVQKNENGYGKPQDLVYELYKHGAYFVSKCGYASGFICI
jgi:hypothetical protein